MCTATGDPKKRLWCSVQVDPSGNHVAHQRRWGHCNLKTCKHCKTISGPAANENCVFPFIFRHKTYTDCTLDGAGNDDSDRVWCSVEVDPDTRKHIKGRWGYCDCTDPKIKPVRRLDKCTKEVLQDDLDFPESGKFLPGLEFCPPFKYNIDDLDFYIISMESFANMLLLFFSRCSLKLNIR